MIFSCTKRSEKTTSELKDTIPAANLIAELGQGFDTKRGLLLGESCLKVAFEESSVTVQSPYDQENEGYLKLDQSLDTVKILDHISGGVGLTYPVYPGVDLTGRVDFAIETSNTESSFNVMWMSRMNQTIASTTDVQPTPHLISLREKANTLGLNRDEKLQFLKDHCGDEYIAETTNGVMFMSIINIDFGSRVKRENFDVSLILELLGGIATIKGSAGILREQFAQSMTVSFALKQIGGAPENLVRLFPENLPTCEFSSTHENWAKPCDQAIRSIFYYMTGEKPSGLEVEGIDTFANQIQASDGGMIPEVYKTVPINDFILLGEESPTQLVQSPPNNNSQWKEDRAAALRTYFAKLEALSSFRKQLSLMLDSTEEDLKGPMAVYYQTILREFYMANRYIRQLREKIKDCWSAAKLSECIPQKATELISRLELEHPIDASIIDYAKSIPALYDWCLLRGPKVASGPSYPKSLLLNHDEILIDNLFRF